MAAVLSSGKSTPVARMSVLRTITYLATKIASLGVTLSLLSNCYPCAHVLPDALKRSPYSLHEILSHFGKQWKDFQDPPVLQCVVNQLRDAGIRANTFCDSSTD